MTTHNDIIHRFIFDETDIRGEIVALEESFQQAYEHQEFHSSLRPLFGDFLAGAALLSEVLKFEGTLTLQAKGDGPVNLIMAEATHDGKVRGIIRVLDPSAQMADMSDLSLPQILGNSILTITIDPLKGARYQGIIPVDAPNLAGCLEHYFAQSEQLPTDIRLFATDKHCGGLFLQCLPAQEVKDETLRQEKWEMAEHLAATVSADEIFSLDNQEVLLRLFHEMTCRVFEPKAIQFACSCSRERSMNAIQSIGKAEADDLIQERGEIRTDCQFCGQQYIFNAHDVAEMFDGDGNTLH